jgi:hypothetical protein
MAPGKINRYAAVREYSRQSGRCACGVEYDRRLPSHSPANRFGEKVEECKPRSVQVGAFTRRAEYFGHVQKIVAVN